MVKKHPKSSHKKPTQEELDKLTADAEALAKKKKKSPEPKPTEPEPTKPEPTEPESPEPSEPEPPAEPSEPEPTEPTENDLKKKLSASARENQKIAAKNRKVNEAIDKASDIPEPTDEEMKAEYPDWDIMEDFARKLAKEAIMGKKFRENLVKAREEGRKIEKWNEQVDKFVADPETLTKNPDLEGRLDEFKVYASDEANASVPFKVLVPAFLHNSTPPKKNKGQMFPKGSAGPSDSGRKDNRLTIEQGRALRKRDHKKWKQMLMAGKIQMDIKP